MVTLVGMSPSVVSVASKSVDGVTPLRALALQAYWALRRVRPPDLIGTSEIHTWMRTHTPRADRPSGSLVRTTLLAAGVPHRKMGRPRRGTTLRPVPPPPFARCAAHPLLTSPQK